MDARLRELERRASAGDQEAAGLLRAAVARVDRTCARCGRVWGALELVSLQEQGMTCGACWPGPGWELAGQVVAKQLRKGVWTFAPPRPVVHIARHPSTYGWAHARETLVLAECSRVVRLHPATVRWIDRTIFSQGQIIYVHESPPPGLILANPAAPRSAGEVHPRDLCRRCVDSGRFHTPIQRVRIFEGIARNLRAPEPLADIAPLFRREGT